MSLDSLIKDVNDGLKFVFVGGKGGVGKTTSSSAIASLLTKTCNKRVLLVSTDPAHSLGDAWRTSFSNVPTSPMPNLDVMEVDPKETMEAELGKWVEYAKEFEGDENDGLPEDSKLLEKINSFQEWLSGIPGIDEATALSSAITYIESGKYDLIVFDTAPTGHTLKLLALPEILESGIEKLQSWQTTIWTYWEAFKGLTSVGGSTSKAKRRTEIKEEVAQKLIDYKNSIQKVATMLQDQTRTRFVVVCIAEYLSVNETQRLLQELEKNKVRASHIVVNQLVVEDALSHDELSKLETLAELGNLQLDQALLQKTVHACRLTTSRKAIQLKYLKVLKGFKETQDILEGICEVPLLAEEVTGTDAIGRFSRLLVTDKVWEAESNGEEMNTQSGERNQSANEPVIGDIIRIMGLEKADHLNGLEGKIISNMDKATGRYGVGITYEGKYKKVALQAKNLSIVRAGYLDKNSKAEEPSKKMQRLNSSSNNHGGEQSAPAPSIPDGTMSKALKILEDPEIKAMVDGNPKVKSAVEDVLANPMNFMRYVSDPELSPFLMKAMNKLSA